MPNETIARQPAIRRVDLILMTTAAILVPLAYVLYTGHIWEDYFITFRYSRNLVEGRGLVFNPGEKVHGFTSPLGVLLPAFAYWAQGGGSYVPALWAFRILSIVAFAAGGILVVRAIRRQWPETVVPGLILTLFYVGDVKGVAFTVNGMETGLMLFFVAWGLALLSGEGLRAWWAMGLCWAGLMWTRPDGCMYVAALAVAGAAFGRRPRRELLVPLVKCIVLCTLLYLPWFAWAWDYYGSPVPNTIRAKALYQGSYADFAYRTLWSLPSEYWKRTSLIFAPIYYGALFLPGLADWPRWMGTLSSLLGLVASVYWLVPGPDRMGRSASLCFLLLCLYTVFVPNVFPWYLPPLATCCSVALVAGTWHVARVATDRFPLAPSLAAVALLSVAAALGYIFALTTWQMAVQQEEIENRLRTRLGLWLKEQVRPNERVLLESLGYFGYFSEAHIIDFPGLVSPEVVRLRKERGLAIPGLAAELHPDWVIGREGETVFLSTPAWRLYGPQTFLAISWGMGASPGGLSAPLTANTLYPAPYEVVAIFDVRPRLQPYLSFPGIRYLAIDRVFYVLKKRSAPDAARRSSTVPTIPRSST